MTAGRRHWLFGLLIAGLGLGLAACRPAALPDPAQPATVSTHADLQASPGAIDRTRPPLTLVPATLEAQPILPMTPPAATPGPLDPNSQQWVAHATADLAARLGVPAGQISLLEFRAVIWPDSSLGCPQPGMAYLQVLTEGYLIRLGVGDQVYSFHGREGRAPQFCERPSPDVSPGLNPDT